MEEPFKLKEQRKYLVTGRFRDKVPEHTYRHIAEAPSNDHQVGIVVLKSSTSILGYQILLDYQELEERSLRTRR